MSNCLKIFLLHHSADGEVVKDVALMLSGFWRMQVLFDELASTPGESLTPESGSFVNKANALVVFWSSNAAGSPYVQVEIDLTIERIIRDNHLGAQVIQLDETSVPDRYKWLLGHRWELESPLAKSFQHCVSTLANSLSRTPDY